MAFSPSIACIGKAQTPAVCQFCEESTEIKWKCINCELFLCQLCCSKIHNKIKASMEHEIINLKQFETEDFATSMRKVELDNMVCTIHAKQRCFVFCQDCSQPACSKCLTETHKMHNYKALDEVYNGIFCEMKELINKFDSNLKIFQNEKDKMGKILSDGDNNFQETRKIILQTEKEMKEAISKHSNELLRELEAKWKTSENMIQTELSSIIKNMDELETRRKYLIQALQSHQVADIFSTSKTLNKSLQKCLVKTIQTKQTKFIAKNTQMKTGNLMFGDLYTIPGFELIDTFVNDLDNVTQMLFGSTNSAFIGSFDSQKIQKVKFENHKIKIKSEITVGMYSIAGTHNGKILVSTADSHLKLYTDGKLQTFKSFSPLKTLGVHVTLDCKIIVGLIESFPIKTPAIEDSIRRLVVMNQAGDIQHTIEYDRDGQKMFTSACRINSFNDKIVVIDIFNQLEEGRVVMIDNGGQLHWTYNGFNSSNSDQVMFCPTDLEVTFLDMTVVSDVFNHAIHILNPDGVVILHNDVKGLGIEFPFSLCFDKNEVLWIGCSTPTIDKRKKAKIHCVKLI